MRVAGDDGETVWCSIIAFDATAVEALGQLAGGDTVAIAGHASLSTWTGKDGQHKAGLKVTVNKLMSVYEAGETAQGGQQRLTCARAVIHGDQ